MTITYSVERKHELTPANDAFANRLNFLAATAGQPHLQIAQQMDRVAIERYEARGRALRAAAIRAAFRQVAGGVTEILKKVSVKLKNWYQHRQDIKTLLALDDYMLNDIGLTRGDIELLSRGRISASELNTRRVSRTSPRKRSCTVHPFDPSNRNRVDATKRGRTVRSEDLELAA